MNEITLRIGLVDGTFQDETVNFDFTDIPEDDMTEILVEYPEEIERNAAMLRAKLSNPVPQDVMVGFLERLQRGEGVTFG